MSQARVERGSDLLHLSCRSFPKDEAQPEEIERGATSARHACCCLIDLLEADLEELIPTQAHQ
jgi:hypothetical protein